jgi:hypothetical protein
MLIREGAVSNYDQDTPCSLFQFLAGKGVFCLKKADLLSTLFVGIDIGSRSHVVALESTSFYGIHIANYVSSCEVLALFHTLVCCFNPKVIRNYKKPFIDLGKNDAVDAFVIADFACANRITTQPWRGSQFLALQRLTRHLPKEVC